MSKNPAQPLLDPLRQACDTIQSLLAATEVMYEDSRAPTSASMWVLRRGAAVEKTIKLSVGVVRSHHLVQHLQDVETRAREMPDVAVPRSVLRCAIVAASVLHYSHRAHLLLYVSRSW